MIQSNLSEIEQESDDMNKSHEEYVTDSEKEVDDLPESEVDEEDTEEDTEDDVSTSEVDEEEEIDEYQQAVERYAQLIREVPQDNVGGIVEIIEKIFEKRYETFDNDDIICGVIVSGAVILAACLGRMCFL